MEHCNLEAVSLITRIFLVDHTEVEPSFFVIELSEVAVHVYFFRVKTGSIVKLRILGTLIVAWDATFFTILLMQTSFTLFRVHLLALKSLLAGI